MRIALLALFATSLLACDPLGADSADAGDAAGACGTATCNAMQVCLYRQCSTADRCRVSSTCRASETPTTCAGGQPGGLSATCTPVVQGCRDIPTACSGDVTCACGSICGSPSSCAQVSGINAVCAAAN